jgi:lactate racemase
MNVEFGYNRDVIEVNIDDNNFMGVLKPNTFNPGITGQDEVKRALRNPIGSKRLSDIIKPGEKIAIITSDITRPMPSKTVLDGLLKDPGFSGVHMDDIVLVFALGIHRKHTEKERIKLVGDDIYSKIRCIDSDSEDYVMMGKTSNGTPVEIFRPVAEADRLICLGNIEYHYFAGYSGGAKAVMPGVSTQAAIQVNHSMMVMPGAKAGRIEDNPIRQDIEEVEKFMHIDFILNVVLDEKKNTIKAVAGHHIHAHREGCKFLDGLYKVKIPGKADIVIVSPGGYPKDINLYQAQKALDNAKHAVKKGGIIILVASCGEGMGNDVFEKWMIGAKSSEDMIERIGNKFELGGHKAAAIAMVLQNADIFLVSDMPDEFVKRIFMKPFKSVQTALENALESVGANSGVLAMPYGGSTLPCL